MYSYKGFIRRVLVIIMLLSSQISAASDECVILFHGMGRTSFSMTKIESELKQEGYSVINQSYPSLTEKVESISQDLMKQALGFCQQQRAEAIHYVPHSLGGILVRYYLQSNQIEKLGRIVMLAPPNQGSEVVDAMKDGYLYKLVMGPNAQALGTEGESLPNRLVPVAGEIGIIAGEKESASWFLPEIPGPDDGKVAVERTKLAEMKDFIIVESGHTTIMNKAEVIHQVVYFLKHGWFDRTN